MSTEARVGYQGIKGSFSYQASADFFPEMTYRGYRSFQEVMFAVEQGDIDYAMIPVENSTAGRVFEVYHLLPESGLRIVGEYLLPIHHCLMIPHNAFRGTPPAGLSAEDVVDWKNSPLTDEEKATAFATIREVHSHPQALAQCRKFVQKNLPKAAIKETYDTAGSARDIATRDDAMIAAIASKSAGEIFNMIILQKNIEDNAGNTTRFLALTRKELAPTEIKGPVLTTILFETAHEPGSLYRALNVFERHNINLTKLETYMAGAARPNPTFYVDIGANMMAPEMKQVLEEFKAHTASVHIMGCYPACGRRGAGSSFLSV